jgi:hypothetical protein
VNSSGTVVTCAPRIRGISWPQRHHLDDALAGIDQQLRDEHQRADPRARHRDPLPRHGPVQPRQIRGERAAQLGNAEVVRVERFARVDRIQTRAADEFRRRLVGLADPERQQVRAEAFVEELADLRRSERANRGSRGEHEVVYPACES